MNKKTLNLEESLETQFIYSIHKTLLSFSHLNSNNQKIVINDIKNFIQKLTLIFQNQSVLSPQEKRFKIIDILVKYLDRLFNFQIYHYLIKDDKNDILKQIDDEAKESTLHHLRKIHKKKNIDSESVFQSQSKTQTETQIDIKEELESDINHQSHMEQNNIEIEYINIQENDNENNQLEENNLVNEINYYNNNLDSNEQFGEITDENWRKWEDICIDRCEKYIEDNLKNIEKKWIEKLIECKRNITTLDKEVDNKVELVIRSKFVDMENHIKKFIRENLTKIYQLESDNQDKTSKLIESTKLEYDSIIQERITESMKIQYNELYKFINNSLEESVNNANKIEEELNNRINNKIGEYIKEVNGKLKENIFNIIEKNKELKNWKDDFIKNFLTQINDSDSPIKNLINSEVENKIQLLSSIFQTNISEYFEKISSKINDHQKEFINSINPNILNQLNLQFSKDLNEIQLLHSDNLISSIKLSVKGMIGPKGPQGKSPKIKSIKFNNDSKLIFTIEGDNNDYDIVSESSIPVGPQGPKGEKGEPGTIYNDLKYQDYSVFRIDSENNNQIILLKSLSIGDNSHCLQNNSLAIGGGTCYKSESISIGRKSKTCDNESIALFGTTTGKNAFAYRSTNVDDYQVKFGDNKNDIESFEINSKKIILNAEQIELLGNIKIQRYEDRIQQLEQKIKSFIK